MDFRYPQYVSCIKIGNQPIIPPLLTDELRTEMRYFRDLAITVEKRKILKRHSADSGVMISSTDKSFHKNTETSDASVQSDNLSNNIDDNQEEFVSTVQSKNGDIPTEGKLDERFVSSNQQRERRNSYTLESPSSILIDYISRKSDKKWELFIDSKNEEDSGKELSESVISMKNLCVETTNKTEQLTLEDLETDFTETESTKSINELWNFYDQEELKNHNPNSLSDLSDQKTNSLPSSARASPVSVVRACESTECLKYDSSSLSSDANETTSAKLSGETSPVKNNSWKEKHNCGNTGLDINESVQEFCLSIETSFEKDVSDQFNNDSFSKDFFLFDSSASMNASHEFDAYHEGRCSDCSSVSLSKFLTLDKKLPDGQEAEHTAFSYMKEELERKHRIQLALLLKQQQKEHDSLKIQFNRIASSSKNTPSPKSNYAYSQDVVLKKYSPCGGDSCTVSSQTPVKHEKVVLNESSTPRRPNSSTCPDQKPMANEEVAFNDRSSPRKTNSFTFPLQPPVVMNGEGDLNDRSSRPRETKKCAELSSECKFNEETEENYVDKKMNAAAKINAAARGFLTRRLFKTERVTLLVQTIKDCLVTAVSLLNETDLGLSELDLQSRLLQQLTGACNELNDIFSLPVGKRMAIISADREKKNRLLWRKCKTPLPLSEATRRTLQRRNNTTKSAPPCQRKYWRKRCKSASPTTSESNSCRSTPGSRRPISNAIMSQKFAVSQCNRRPWR